MQATDVQKVFSPVNIEERASLDIRPGDTVRVHQKIQEKGKTRIQLFEGVILARKHGSEPGATFTVRRVVGGVGVEKIFPLYSPMIDKIEVVRRAKVRRSKLYYIREKAAREIRRQMRRMTEVDISTESDAERIDRETQEAAEAEAKAVENASEENVANGTTDLEEKMDEATVEEVKEQINEDDPEKN